jgi:NADPH:quinone reductase-like Zn-dependent oxidoreductase
LFGVQIAKMHGAEAIVSGSAHKREQAIALGADHFIDRRQEGWSEAILQLTGDHGADHILEIVGGAHLGEAIEVVAVGGRIHQIGVLGVSRWPHRSCRCR